MEEHYVPIFLVDPFDRQQFFQEISQIDEESLWTALKFNLPTLVFHTSPVTGNA